MICNECGYIPTTRDASQGTQVFFDAEDPDGDGNKETALVAGDDYTVSYSNNIEVGTAEVIIKGIGNYTGEYRKDFQIVAPELGNVTGIQISDNTTGSFSVKWNKVENATGYVVSYYSGTFRKWMKLGDTTATSFNANDLSKGTVYKLRIRAFKKIGSKYYYGAFAYANTATKPEKVKTFTIKNITNAGYTLAWTRVQGATEYQVLKYDSSKGKYVGIARGPITSYKISGKSAGQKDKYAVRAIKNYDGVYYYGEFNKRSFVTRPQKVATVKTTVDRGTLKISWSKVSNAEGYLVYYSTQKNGAYTRLAQIKGNKTFSYTTTKLAGKRVYIKVKAYRMADSTIIGGTASNAKYAKVFNNKTYNEIINSYINSYTIKGVNAQGYTISSAKRWELYNALTYIGKTASFAMLDLDSGVFIGYNAKSYLPTASTVKMPYMLYALKQMEDGYPTLDTMLTYQSWDYSSGTSEIVKYPYGTKFSMRQVIHYICAYSDNCGYYMLQDYFGYSGYNRYIASLGCRTSVSSSVRWGVVSAADSTREWIEMYDYLYNGRYGYFMRNELKKRGIKIISIVLVIVTITALMAVPASATWMYPDGATVYDYLVNTDDYNRTIYVYHRDTSGNLLKYCVYYTETHGDYDVFGDSLYGYDIVAYESNQGLGEQCHLTWAAGNGEKAGISSDPAGHHDAPDGRHHRNGKDPGILQCTHHPAYRQIRDRGYGAGSECGSG